jgi:hypothetical protein
MMERNDRTKTSEIEFMTPQDAKKSQQMFTLQITTPNTTSGTVKLPFSGEITVDGKESVISKSTQSLLELNGGVHFVTVKT